MASTEKTVPAFTKAQLLASKRYAGRRDALAALLKDGNVYTLAEVDKALGQFMKGKVK